MPLPRSRRSAAVVGSLALAVTGLAGLAATPADANPAGTGLVISEVYGGGGNAGATYTNDFIELYNPTGAAISVDGWSVQYRSAGGTSATVTTLSGSVPARGSYLVQEAKGSGGTTALPTPDATGTAAMSATAGVVILSDGTTGISTQGNLAGAAGVVDAVGFGGASSYEGAGPAPAPTNTTSAARTGSGTDTDDNAADFTVGAPTPRNSGAGDTGGGGTTEPVKVATIPDAYGKVGSAITPITASASGGTAPYTWSASGLPTGVTIDGASGSISGTPTTSGDDKVTVTATDAAGATGTTTFYLAIGAPHSIAEVQGTDTDVSPLSGKEVDVQGVVTGAYPTSGLAGFFIETGGAGGAAGDDQTPGASDGVFVFGADAAKQVTVGESVDVVGQVTEYKGETEIQYPSVTELDSGLPAVVPDTLAWSDLDTDAKKEAHEGELIAPEGDFTVTDNYDANFYGTIELAAGDRMLKQPTDVGTPGSQAAQDAAAYNVSHAIFLDDGSSWSYGPTSHDDTPMPWLTPSTPVSDGAKATFDQPVVLDYRNSDWSLEPQAQVTGDGSDVATFSDMRSAEASPGAVGSDVKLATFNMENFFTTTGDEFVSSGLGHCTFYKDRDGNEISDNTCTTIDGGPGPRGAATEAAYQKQLAKAIVGIDGLGASVVSLEEVENSVKFGEDRDTTVSALVQALNDKDGPGTWAFVPSPSADQLPPLDEQDVIRTAFIYKPADITPVGVSQVLTGDSDPGQPFSIAREPLAQGFKAAGAQDSDAFMVVANHLKSKGADADGLFNDCASGGDAENTDPVYDQGGFNCSRVHQVQDMWAWAQQQAQQLGTSRVFLVGDFNAYDHEDPIEYLYDQGFTDLASTYDADHSSYSYGGLEGSLDHVLASPDALAMVTGATIWQIDAQESVAYAYSRDNYNVTELYDGTTPWATSDHDPEVVGLTLPHSPAPSTVAAPDQTVVFAKEAPRFPVTVTADGATPTGTVTLSDGDTVIGSAGLTGGSAVIALPAKSYKRGSYTFTVAYSGDAEVAASSTTVTLTVTNPAGT